MSDLEEFLDEFDHYTHEVSVARHQDFQRALLIWFQTLDQAPEPLASRIRQLRDLFPPDNLKTEVIKQGRGMVGSGRLNWPLDREQRLSAQLILLEAMTEKEDSAWQFAYGFFPSGGGNINDTLAAMVEGLFEPHSRELRRYFEKNADKQVDVAPPLAIPAADRTVTIDHNRPVYHEVDDALDAVETALQKTNEGDPDEKERAIAEVSALRRLLQAVRVRIALVVSLIGGAVTWAASQFADTAAGKAAEWAIEKLIEFLPLLSGFL